MKFKTKKLSIAEIAVVPSEIDDREIIQELAKRIGDDSLEIMLTLHPICLHEITPNVYHIICGEQQLRLARSLFGQNHVVSAQIFADKNDASIALLTEALIVPLLLSASSAELQKRIQLAKKDPAIHHLGRNFHLDSTWGSLLKQSHEKRTYKRKQSK